MQIVIFSWIVYRLIEFSSVQLLLAFIEYNLSYSIYPSPVTLTVIVANNFVIPGKMYGEIIYVVQFIEDKAAFWLGTVGFCSIVRPYNSPLIKWRVIIIRNCIRNGISQREKRLEEDLYNRYGYRYGYRYRYMHLPTNFQIDRVGYSHIRGS